MPEIRREGFRALVDRLGLADALRFIQQYDPGRGDYAAERHQWLDHLTLDDIMFLRCGDKLKKPAGETLILVDDRRRDYR